MREGYRKGHQLGRLIARKAEHHPRVAGAAHIYARGDIGRLLVDADHDAAGLGVKAVLGARIADLSNGLPDDPRDVDVAIRGDLPHHHDQAGGHDGLAGHPGQRIFGQDRVEEGVRDLVGQLVGMAFGD